MLNGMFSTLIVSLREAIAHREKSGARPQVVYLGVEEVTLLEKYSIKTRLPGLGSLGLASEVLGLRIVRVKEPHWLEVV